MRNASVAFGAHSLYVMLLCASTLNPNLSVPCITSQTWLAILERGTNSAKLVQSPFRIIDSGNPVLCLLVSVSKRFFEWGEPRVEFDHAYNH